MRKEEIEITIHANGQLEYTVKGIKGPACDSVSQLLEQIGVVEASEQTGEYYERETDTDIHVQS